MAVLCLDTEADFVFDSSVGEVRLRRATAARLQLLAPMLRASGTSLVVALTKVDLLDDPVGALATRYFATDLLVFFFS